MKGIILAAGKGTRLYPITVPICKPLLPIYDKPLVYYSLASLMYANIREVLIIVPPGGIPEFQSLLGDGTELGMHIEYIEQLKQRGIADAFILGKDFIADETVCLALGDNIFFGPSFNMKAHEAASNLLNGATIFGYYVDDPKPFGVVEFDTTGKAISIEEKPDNPKSNYIVPGLYYYDNSVVDIAKEIKPSKRGELEITSVNNEYLKYDQLQVVSLGKEYSWFDAGTAEGLFIASEAVRNEFKNGQRIAYIEEIAFRNGWINDNKLFEIAEHMKQTEYGQYLMSLLKQ